MSTLEEIRTNNSPITTIDQGIQLTVPRSNYVSTSPITLQQLNSNDPFNLSSLSRDTIDRIETARHERRLESREVRFKNLLLQERHVFTFIISFFILVMCFILMFVKVDKDVDGLYSSLIGIIGTIVGSYLTIITKAVTNDSDNSN